MFGLLGLVLGTGRRRALWRWCARRRASSPTRRCTTRSRGCPTGRSCSTAPSSCWRASARQPGMLAGALFIDIDGFKHVNDNLGHAAGDQLLKIVGERLQGAVRDQDTVGRLGGDEFVVLVDSTADEATLDLLADRLTEVLREPVRARRRAQDLLGDGEHRRGRGPVRHARTACCATPTSPCMPPRPPARTAMRCSTRACTRAPKAASSSRPTSAPRCSEDQFFLLYQPIFDLPEPGGVVGVEALIRWRAPRARHRGARQLHPAGRGERADRARSAAGCSRRPAARRRLWADAGLETGHRRQRLGAPARAARASPTTSGWRSSARASRLRC